MECSLLTEKEVQKVLLEGARAALRAAAVFESIAIPVMGHDELLVLAPFISAYIPFCVHDWVSVISSDSYFVYVHCLY